MFYDEIPAELRPDIKAKPAVDAVALAGALRANQYECDPFMLDVTRIGSREQALSAISAYAAGSVNILAQIDPIVEIVVPHDIHGSHIPFEEFSPEGAKPWEVHQVPMTREGTALMDAGGQCLSIVVHVVTSETRLPALRSIISDVNSSLRTMLNDVTDLAGHRAIYLVGDEPIA